MLSGAKPSDVDVKTSHHPLGAVFRHVVEKNKEVASSLPSAVLCPMDRARKRELYTLPPQRLCLTCT